jgi:hypothetical protein
LHAIIGSPVTMRMPDSLLCLAYGYEPVASQRTAPLDSWYRSMAQK